MHSLSLCDDPHVAVFSWVHRGSNELLHQREGVPVGDVRPTYILFDHELEHLFLIVDKAGRTGCQNSKVS